MTSRMMEEVFLLDLLLCNCCVQRSRILYRNYLNRYCTSQLQRHCCMHQKVESGRERVKQGEVEVGGGGRNRETERERD